MTRRRNNRQWLASNPLAAYRLRVERLESRRLLAGLQVSVFVDQDGSRSLDAGQDVAAANRLVYLDLDRNGARSAGEPIQVTNADGVAFFSDLAAGNYSVGLLTNPSTQRQSTSVSVEPVANRESDFNAAVLLADELLENVWMIDDAGVANRTDSQDAVELGGAVLSHTMSKGNLAGLVIDASDGSGHMFVEFDLESGRTKATYILGLEPGDRIREIAGTRDSTFVLVEAEQGMRLGRLQVGERSSALVELHATDATALAASSTHSSLVTISRAPNGNSRVLLRATNSSLTVRIPAPELPTELSGTVQSASFSRDGQRLMIAMDGGGVNVLRIDDGTLRLEAVLTDASAPISAESLDGRLLTGSVSDNQEIVVWDTQLWMPVGASRLTSGSLSSSSTLLTDRFGDRAVVAGDDGVYSVDLAVVGETIVHIGDDADASVEMGVRVLNRENSIPDVSRVTTRSIDEDSPDTFSANSQLGIRDADGDALWFSLLTPPTRGKLELSHNGVWTYLPNSNYSGKDRAVILVHDGQASVALALQWQIAPVNDPPIDFYVHLPAVAENLEPGSPLGFATVVDPDRGAEYHITSADSRFKVIDGQVFFVDGSLDFETEPNIAFELVATDPTNPEFSISTIATLALTNVNERPRSIRVESDGIPENVAGAVVGRIVVDDPDAYSEYEFEVSDPRFVVRDGFLQLLDGQEFDFETLNLVELNITASESGSSGHSIVQRLPIPVLDRNDPPTKIRLTKLQVNTATGGAIVGVLNVDDPDDDAYTYQVSDKRFEVRGGVLKLREDEILDDSEPSIDVTVVATSDSGDEVTEVFPVVIVPRPSPHQNPINPRDVNGDGIVTPLDALILINELNRTGGGRIFPAPGSGSGEKSPIRPDVNGDEILSPLDVLIIINDLNNSRGLSEGPEGEALFVSASPEASFPLDDLEERRKQTNSDIDSELEGLVEELSRHRVHRF